MKLHKISIVIIIMSMIILSITTFINDLGNNYGASDFEGLENTQERLDSQLNLSEDLQKSIDTITLKEDTSILLIPYALIKAGWTITKLLFSPMFIFNAILSDISTSLSSLGLPLPTWLIASLQAIMWILLAAILVYAFFKWKFKDED